MELLVYKQRARMSGAASRARGLRTIIWETIFLSLMGVAHAMAMLRSWPVWKPLPEVREANLYTRVEERASLTVSEGRKGGRQAGIDPARAMRAM